MEDTGGNDPSASRRREDRQPGQGILTTPMPCRVARLPGSRDLIAAVLDVCRQFGITQAGFRVTGVVTSFTIGSYDAAQQVYVTHHAEGDREIVSCCGDVTSAGGHLQVCAHIILSDQQGVLTGGRLFSETRLFGGDIQLQEWQGDRIGRVHDDGTGLLLWAADP